MVYAISRSQLNEIAKVVNRVKKVKIFNDDDNGNNIEIYLKTIHSDDYIYFDYHPSRFY
jgi:hypothetical protein